jgi:putative ABC transport system substrate-binding protein
MRRRDFVTLFGGAAATWPFAADAQQSALPVVGYFNPGWPENNPSGAEGFRHGLAEAGYVEGRNVRVEYRWAEGHYDRLPAIAADFVRQGVDVIAACGSSAPGLAAKAATEMIPIVFQTGADPIADGLVASMNRPGGNITGVSRMTVALESKRLELLRDVVPDGNVFAILTNRDSPRTDLVIAEVQKAGRSLGLSVIIAKVAKDELEEAFAMMARQQVRGLLVSNDPAMQSWMNKIVALTAQYAIPGMFNTRAYVVAGGLMSYDSSIADSYRQAGSYVGLILKGAKPRDLPVLEPTKFEFVLNLKAAKALKLKLPQTLLATADEVIE